MKKILETIFSYPHKKEDRFVFFLLLYTALLVTSFEYFFIPIRVGLWLNSLLSDFQPGLQLRDGFVWVGSCLVGYTLLPFLLLTLCDGKSSAKGHGWSGSGFLAHLPIYLLLYLAMLPLVFYSFQQPAFRFTYPMIPIARVSVMNFLLWEGAYCLQFFALESFFRGWLLFSLEKHMNQFMAVAVAAVPYTMIHFHKPAPEAFGALVAGIVLGRLSLHFRSWYGGAILHCLVAVTMDSLSMFAGTS